MFEKDFQQIKYQQIFFKRKIEQYYHTKRINIYDIMYE